MNRVVVIWVGQPQLRGGREGCSVAGQRDCRERTRVAARWWLSAARTWDKQGHVNPQTSVWSCTTATEAAAYDAICTCRSTTPRPRHHPPPAGALQPRPAQPSRKRHPASASARPLPTHACHDQDWPCRGPGLPPPAWRGCEQKVRRGPSAARRCRGQSMCSAVQCRVAKTAEQSFAPCRARHVKQRARNCGRAAMFRNVGNAWAAVGAGRAGVPEMAMLEGDQPSGQHLVCPDLHRRLLRQSHLSVESRYLPPGPRPRASCTCTRGKAWRVSLHHHSPCVDCPPAGRRVHRPLCCFLRNTRAHPLQLTWPQQRRRLHDGERQCLSTLRRRPGARSAPLPANHHHRNARNKSRTRHSTPTLTLVVVVARPRQQHGVVHERSAERRLPLCFMRPLHGIQRWPKETERRKARTQGTGKAGAGAA